MRNSQRRMRRTDLQPGHEEEGTHTLSAVSEFEGVSHAERSRLTVAVNEPQHIKASEMDCAFHATTRNVYLLRRSQPKKTPGSLKYSTPYLCQSIGLTKASQQIHHTRCATVSEAPSRPAAHRTRASSGASLSSAHSTKITLELTKSRPTLNWIIEPSRSSAFGAFTTTKPALSFLRFVATSRTGKMGRHGPNASWSPDFDDASSSGPPSPLASPAPLFVRTMDHDDLPLSDGALLTSNSSPLL
jgi:hypothetical protein